MAAAKRFEDPDVWRRAKERSNFMYRHSAEGTFARDFDLRVPIRRAEASVRSNIAGGLESQARSMFLQSSKLNPMLVAYEKME